jgi:lipopolysaccharide biosynthesis regulator YciM
MTEYTTLAAALVALLLGLTVGKAWERYKLRDGRWIDRRKARESPHYILGLNFLVANQIEPAIEELTRAAASLTGEALEIDMILGNLYREKGQVGRAIQVHQALLQRPKLTSLEHAYVLLCLGLDFKRAGFVDRALEAFNQVLRLDPRNRYALVNLEKLHEEQHQWPEAYRIRQQLTSASERDDEPRNREILAFLETQLGEQARRQGDAAGARLRFEAAIEMYTETAPAYLNLGDMQMAEGQVAQAIDTWKRFIDIAPERAYLALGRLEAAYPHSATPDGFPALCRELIQRNPGDWRARLALARYLANRHDPAAALELLFESLTHNPHGLSIHEETWKTLVQLHLAPALVQRYMELTGNAVFYLDPHVCLRCHYRSTELLWQCPHCHEWNTFVEERITPAKENDEPAGTPA